jgi:SAM-dependent MidA family methyltransferase
VKQIDAQLTQTVVELGPGDGVIIQYILEKLQALNIPPAWVIACKKQTSSLLAPQ